MAIGQEQAPRAPTRELGMFERHGLPSPGSRLRLQRKRNTQDQAMFEELLERNAAMVSPNDRGVFQAFARLGRGLAGGGQGGQLSPEEEAQFDAVNSAQQRLVSLKEDRDFQKLPPEEQAFRAQQELGRAMMDAGDVATGAQIMGDAAEKKRKQLKASLEMRKLQEDVDQLPEEREEAAAARRRAAAGEWDTFVVGGAGDNLARPNQTPQTVTGRVRADGTLETSDGESYENFMDMSTHEQLLKAQGGGADRLAPITLFHKTFGTKERSALRSQDAAVQNMQNIVEGIGKGFDNLVRLGEDPGQIVGPTGAVVNFSRNFVDTLKSLGSAFRLNQPVVDEQGDVVVSNPMSESGTSDLVSRFDSAIFVPDGVVPEERARYQSAVMQMAYSIARLNEPGSGRLSDQDVRAALEELGADQADPRRMATNMVDILAKRTRNFRTRVKQVGGVGESIPGLGRDRAMMNVFGRRDPMDGIDNALNSINSLISEAIPQAPGTRDPVTGDPNRSMQTEDPEEMDAQLEQMLNGLPDAL